VSAQSLFTHIVLFALLVSGTPEHLRSADKNPKSNEEVMVDLCRDAVEVFYADLKISDTTEINLHIENGEVNRFFTQPLVESFRKHFVSLYTHSSVSSAEILVSIEEVHVTYGEPFSEGFFSSRKSERKVNGAFRFTAARNSDGKILCAETRRESSLDTVYVNEIPRLQESSGRIASGVLPDRSALERFIEPLIIAGAAGIAVYLFFTIRS
jgi:hypothetical protein